MSDCAAILQQLKSDFETVAKYHLCSKLWEYGGFEPKTWRLKKRFRSAYPEIGL
jgi:hypothetical protein